MKNPKVFYDLRNDLLKLSQSLVNKRLSSSIIRAAMDFDAEFLKWIKSGKSRKDIGNLSNPIIYETLLFLDNLVMAHPDGISKPEFVKHFVQTTNTKYLPTIIGFNKILKTVGSSILEPFAQILSLSDIFDSVGFNDIAEVRMDLLTIEESFRNYFEKTLNKPYDDEISKPRKLSKNDKKKELFFYLLDAVNEKIASALDESGKPAIADQIRNDRLFLMDSNKLVRSGLLGPNRSLSWLEYPSRQLSKTILKRIEPNDNEYNYNLLVNDSMRFSAGMSDAAYEMFFRDLTLKNARGDNSQISRFPFSTQKWLHPSAIALLTITLMKIMSQIKF